LTTTTQRAKTASYLRLALLRLWRRDAEFNVISKRLRRADLACVYEMFSIGCNGELEGHSVERIYLRQRCSHGSW